jgi:bifunctional non-homologous end joining protein LigD
MPPQFIQPCHPTSATQPPCGPGWLHEIKWDGYRVQAHLRDGKATIYTRRGNNWTSDFAPIAAAVAKLKARSAILDGEAVVLDKDGKSDFHALRGHVDRARLRKRLGKLLRRAPATLIEVEALQSDGLAFLEAARGHVDRARLRYCIFDLLELDGADLRPLPLLERRKRLGKLLRRAPATLIEVEALQSDGLAFLEAARKLGLEGIVSKKASAPYRSGR